MTISIDVALTVDDIGLVGGRVYRVGDHGVIIQGNQIASFDDNGVVFEVLEYEPSPGGFGDVDPYHVHDNGDGTMNVYFRLTGPNLPLTHNDVYVTLNADTGAKIGPTHNLPYAGVSGVSGLGHTDASGHADGQMLTQAVSLSDGTIAVVDNSTVLNQFVFKIVNADGTHVATSAPFLSGIASHDSQLLFDLAEVGNKVAVIWANATGVPASLQLFNKNGTLSGAEISLGNATSSHNGFTQAAQVEVLSDGRILAVWTESGTSSGPDQDQSSTWFSILNADGSEAVAPKLVNTEVTKAREDTPLVIVTEDGFIIGYSVLDFSGIQEGRLKEYNNNGVLQDTETGAYIWGVDDVIRTDNNSAFIVGGNVSELTLPGADTPLDGGGGGTGGKTLIGTGGKDTLRGGNKDDKLVGKGNDDKLFGNGGKDELLGGNGNDLAKGGNGIDHIEGGDGNDRLLGEDGGDKLFGDAGKDELFGGTGNDVAKGGNGNDRIEGGADNDKLFGDGGDDKLFGDTGADILFGGNGKDVAKGGNGADRLEGGADNDRLFGEDGNDKLFGDAGTDFLDGGKGDDALTGGKGPDVFVFKKKYGKDTIKDFKDDVDTIRLDDALWTGTLTKQQVINQFASVDGNDMIFDFGNHELKIKGFNDLGEIKDDFDII